jgi:hypothetical protein
MTKSVADSFFAPLSREAVRKTEGFEEFSFASLGVQGRFFLFQELF